MILDIIFIALVVLNVLICFNKGFTRSLFNIFSAIIGILAGVLFYDKFCMWVKQTKYGIAFTDYIEELMLNRYAESVGQTVENADVPKFLKGIMKSTADSFETAVADLAGQISQVLITVISIILLIILIKLSLFIVPKILKAVCKLPVIKQFDKLTGAVFGVVSGIICCVILAYVCGFVENIPQLEFVKTQLDTSFFLSVVKNMLI